MTKGPEEKLMAEWFWLDRWEGSSAAGLPMEARGLYREMLSRSWRQGGSLPADHETVRRLIRCERREWARSWPLVEPYWHVRPDDGRLVNDTQLEVIAEFRQRKAAATERAKKAAGTRWDKPKHAKRNAQALPEDSPPTPSPTPYRQTEDGQQAGSRLGRGLNALIPDSRPGPPPNPLVAGRRPELETKCLRLVSRKAELTGEDPTVIIRKASSFRDRDGVERFKTNPASMTDDRLLSTIADLEADIADLEKGASVGA